MKSNNPTQKKRLHFRLKNNKGPIFTHSSENERQCYKRQLGLFVKIMASSMTFLLSKPLGIEKILDDRVAIHPIFVSHLHVIGILQFNFRQSGKLLNTCHVLCSRIYLVIL
jgi:hypothetical protein